MSLASFHFSFRYLTGNAKNDDVATVESRRNSQAVQSPEGNAKCPRPHISNQKFFAWARDLKADEGLLMAILDVLGDDQTRREMNGRDPISVAHAYAGLRQLDGHTYNFMEASFFDDFKIHSVVVGLENLRQALTIVFAQIVFFASVLYITVIGLMEKVNKKSWDTQGIFENVLIFFLALLGLAIFAEIVLKSHTDAALFNKIVKGLCRQASSEDKLLAQGHHYRRHWLQRLNAFSNIYVAWAFYLLNFPFILSSEKVSDAILNSLATAFIFQIDEMIFPMVHDESKWSGGGFWAKYIPNIFHLWFDVDHAALDGSMGAFFGEYIDHTGLPKTNLVVSRCPASNSGQSDLKHTDDILLVYAAEEQGKTESAPQHFKIRVFRGNSNDAHDHPDLLDQIDYEISGKDAEGFFEDMKEFHCLAEFESDDTLPMNLATL